MAADDVKLEPIQIDFNNELMSSSELFQRRSQSHKIPVRGQKEFLPNDSVQQKACLQKTLEEHWMLVTEERVERAGNLVNAEWIPEEKLVKLKSPAGKFWQTMGFSDQGKQYLFPEEALYLMECGNVQVFYQDLPLSIQEGYENFLSAETVTLFQYQVFGHLKRLGYVVNRFDGLTSLCKQQLNLPLSNSRADKQLKRKWSQDPSFGPCNKKSAAPPEVSSGQHESEINTSVIPAQLQTPQASQDPESHRDPTRNWWTNTKSQPKPDSFQPSVRHWDFSRISFPDLGSYSSKKACLPPPEPSLLPGALQVPECRLAHWHRKINLKKERQPKPRWQKQKRHRWSINDDQRIRRCRNWVEYLELVEKRRSQKHKERPIHLREQEVMPLSQPGNCSSHLRLSSRSSCREEPAGELLEQVSIIQPSNLLLGNSSSDQWRITFKVYQPDTEFKKSCPGTPYTHLCVCSFGGPVPDLHALKQLSLQSGDVQVTFAVVDHGDISFYCFKEFKLPTDIY